MKNITLISTFVVAVAIFAGTASFAVNQPTPTPLADNRTVTRSTTPVANTVANTTTNSTSSTATPTGTTTVVTNTTSSTTIPTPTATPIANNTSTLSTIGSTTTVIATRTAAYSNLAATSDATCIVGTNLVNGTSYCFDSTHIYGNFPEATVAKCIKSNGGTACSIKVESTTKDGKSVLTYRYNYKFYQAYIK